MSNALVLSGGGSKGSYQAGVLLYCAEHTDYQDGFNLISGTSVGAINAAGLGMYPSDQFLGGVEWLVRMWRELGGTKGVWKMRFPPYISGLWAPSLGKTTAVRKFLERNLDHDLIKKSGVALRLTGVDLYSGRLEIFDENCQNIVDAVLASGSFPVFFPPVKIGEGFFTDGGVRDIAPLGEVIRSGGRKILAILTSDPFHAPAVEPNKIKSAFHVLKRIISLLTDEVLYNDVRMCRMVNSMIKNGNGDKFLRDKVMVDIDLIYPTRHLSASLDFSKQKIEDQIELGYEDAKKYFSG